jgi:hypothetical protein
LRNRVEGGFIKIQAGPNKYLHFCGLKIWLAEPIIEEEPKPEPKPEPPKPPTGGIWIDDDSDKIDPTQLPCETPARIRMEEGQA